MRKLGAFVATLMAMCLAGSAQAIPTQSNVAGSLSKAENTCVSPIALFTFAPPQSCNYSGGEDVAVLVGQGPTRKWMGPLDSGGFYPKGFLQDPGTTNGFGGSVAGDGKVNLPITGNITIEDNGTPGPGNGGDDLISGTLVIGAGERAASTSNGNAVERFDSITHTIPATTVSSAADNAMGGFDYVIGSAGFPTLHRSGPGGDDYPSEVASEATGTTSPPDRNVWDVANGGNVAVTNPFNPNPPPPFAAGPYTVEIVTYAPVGGNVGPNIGVATTAVAVGLTCEDGDADATPTMTNDPVPEPIDDCNPDPAIGAGSTWAVSGAEFDNLIIRISTDGNNKVVSADAFYTLEYKINSLFANGPTTPGSYVGGTLNFVRAAEAVDDPGQTTVEDTAVTIDVLANDVLFADPVTVSLPGGATTPNGGTVTIDGTNPGAQANNITLTYTPATGFVGQDSFDYTVADAIIADTATVDVLVTPGGGGGVVLFPIAPDAGVNTGEGQALDIVVGSLPGVSLGTPPATISVVPGTGPASGAVTVFGQTITYAPTGFPSSDQFDYMIQDSQGIPASGTIFVNIGPKLIPVAVDDNATVTQDASVNIPVTANDTAGSGSIANHAVTISFEPISGTAVVESDNSVTYTPDPGVSGTHTFEYTLTDEDMDVSGEPAIVTITVDKGEITIQLPSDSSSAAGPWSLALLTLAVWLRRRTRQTRGTRQVIGAIKTCVGPAATAGLATLAIALMSGAAAAQDAASDERQAADRLVVEEIVVTARKKEENLQDVPIAITAFSADLMERAGIDSLSDVAAFTPGLTFSNLFGEFLPVPVIRGVAPTAIFGENNVAVFIDGVFVAGREGLNAGQLDLARIEVLKGPQSTKYGRNAFAGAINYVSARPGDEFEGEAKVNIGNYEKRQARVMISGPLAGEMLLGRIAIGVDEWAGSYDNVLSQLDIGGYQYKTLQTSLWFTPVDALDVQWAVYLSDDEIDDSARANVIPNCEDREDLELLGIAPPTVEDPLIPGNQVRNTDFSTGSRPQNFCGELPSLPDNALAINDQATGEERELIRSSLNVNWDVGFGTFVSLTGFSKTNQKANSDSNQSPPGSTEFDGSPRVPGTVPFSFRTTDDATEIFPAELTTVSTGDETTEWSQELRFSSPLDRRIRFDVGAYAYSVEAIGGFTDFTARLAGGTGERLPSNFAGLFPAPGTVGDAIFGPRFQNSVDNPVPPGETADEFKDNTRSWSGFAGVEIDFGDRWTVDLGARFSHDWKRKRATLFTDDDDDPDTPEVPDVIDETRRFDYWTGRVGVRFQVSDENMIYASIGNGKKSGGMDLIFGDVLQPETDPTTPEEFTVEPLVTVTDFSIEELTAYELGNKGALWDGRAVYDIALFYNDWKDILMPQVLDTDPDSGLQFEQPEGVDLTGGDATTFGVEASLKVILTETLNVNLGGSWTKAEYDDAELAGLRLFPGFWNDVNGDGIGDAGDISGNELLRQSKWQGNFTLNYERSVFGDWSVYSRSDVLYTGAQWVGASNQAKVPEFVDVNQRLGLETDDLRIELWIENLLDDDTPRAAFRDVTFNNTHLQLPPRDAGFNDMFPFRLSVSHPRRRTFGVSAVLKF